MANKSITREGSEKVVERYLNEKVKKAGGLSIKLLPFLFRGLPDRMCLLPEGRIFFCEVKSKGETPAPIQLLVHKKLRSLGFRVEVVDEKGQIDTILNDYVKRN